MKKNKKLILLAVILGIFLSSVSLIKISGQTPPMLPCEGIRAGCFEGLVALPKTTNTNGYRGFPMSMIYIQENGTYYGYGNTGASYEGYSILGIIGNLAIYSLVSYGVILAISKFKHGKKS